MARRILAALVAIAFLLPAGSGANAIAQSSASCADFDAWEWAQSELDRKSSLADDLDPDGNGVACDELPRGGFAPAWWTDEIPASAVPATLVGITDGDTLTVRLDGVEDTVRLYRSDAPERDGCGGQSATDFTRFVLTWIDTPGTIYLESDETERDRYDRRLAYVWFESLGRPYLLNEVLLRSGRARDVDYGDRLYADQFPPAVQFAERWQLGQWAECGGFDADDLVGSDAPVDVIPQEGPGAGECDPSYPTVCIPPIEVTGDLDCGQIDYRRFQVLPPDPHGFDAEGDGLGCEGE